MPAMFVMNQYEESDGSSGKKIFRTRKTTAGKDACLQFGDRIPEGGIVYLGPRGAGELKSSAGTPTQ
jgi:hypothetical protein